VKNPLNVTHVDRDARNLAGLVALTVLLWAAGGIGMAYVAGFGAVHRLLDTAVWWWLGPAFGAVAVAFCGYFFAYRGIKLADGGPKIRVRALLAVVTAGFGGFFAHGGTALDEYAMRAGGAGAHEARSRVIALAGFEHGGMAFVVWPAAVAALIVGAAFPRTDFTWPWALVPPGGFAVAIWLAERFRDRLRDRGGLRGKLGLFFDGVHVVWELLRRPRRHGYAVLGMMLYWGGDMFALWAATRAFGYAMSPLVVIVCLGTGMILTRRTAPLGGAGVMVVALTATLWYGGDVPFAAATLGVSAYRAFTLLAPIPFGFAALPKLRELGRHGEGAPEGEGAASDRGEPALEA
jgi:hypothetical protein